MVEQKQLLSAIKQAKENSTQRKFTQSIDIIINLKELAKNEKVEELATFPHKSTKQSKVCALVGGELASEAKTHCDKAILENEFGKYDKRAIKKLARQHDFFIAQANIMPDIAKVFGKYLAPVRKMPNPKFGQIVPPKAKLKPLTDKLKSSVVLRTIKSPVIQARIGDEKMSDSELADNAKNAIDLLLAKLSQGQGNIKSILIKTTMGQPVKL